MVDPIAAEARAVEQGAHAVSQPDGSFRVRSATRPGVSYRVTAALMPWAGRFAFKFACECVSGTARPSELVPCWHAALVGRRVERIGWATWEHGHWWATDAALESVGILTRTPAQVHKIGGRCPVCSAFLTISYSDDEKRSPHTVAASHDAKCAGEYARRRVRVAGELQAMERTGKALDPWDRKRGDS